MKQLFLPVISATNQYKKFVIPRIDAGEHIEETSIFVVESTSTVLSDL